MKADHSMTVDDQLRRQCRERLSFLNADFMSSSVRRDVWRLLLTQEQRNVIGEKAFFRQHVVESWIKVHGGTPAAALITIAGRLGKLTEVDKLAFPKVGLEISEENAGFKDRPQVLRPKFCSETGSLSYGDAELASFRVVTPPTQIERILKSFEAAEWPSSIRSPWANAKPTDKGLPPDVNIVVRHLNDAIKKKNRQPQIHFGVRRGGKSIIWKTTISADQAP